MSRGLAALTLTLCAWHSYAIADLATQYRLNVPAQPVAEALKAFAAQTKLQIVYYSDIAEGAASPGVVGALTAAEALKSILSGTGLTFRFINDRTIAVSSSSDSSAATSPGGSDSTASAVQDEGSFTSGNHKKSFWDRLRIAQVDQSKRIAQVDQSKRDETPATSERRTQSSSDDNRSVKLEEIVVTAQKRAERLFDVPMSVVALTAEELRRRSVTNLDDLSLAVPGLKVQSSGSYQRRVTLRGISNIFGASSLIGLYLDEVSVTSTPTFQLDLRTYDLERVEVLRGPQGTLYGEGSVGGTIRFITKNPVLDRFTLATDVAALFTQDGAPSQRIESVLNVPLVENKFALRIVGTFDHQGGWIDQPAAQRENFNEQNLTNVRIKGLWQPAPDFTVNAMAVIHRNDAPPNTGEDADGNFTQAFNLTTTPMIQDDYDLYNLTMTYDFDSARLLSTTSYVKPSKKIERQPSRLQIAAPPAPYFDSLLFGDRSARTLTDELRLMSTGSGPWQWTVGGYYRHTRSISDAPFRYFGPLGPPGTPLPTPLPSSHQETLFKSWSAFADTSYRLTDRVTLGAGVNSFHEEQESASSSGPTQSPTQSGRFHSVNPRIYAQYKLTDRVNTYASVAKGFRSGGFNRGGLPKYNPERVWTYELGTKMAALEGQLTSEAALFYSHYSDYQILGVVPASIVGITSNAGNVGIKGVEWTLTWSPADEWSLSVAGDYVHSKFLEINAARSSYNVGDPLDLFPKYGFTVSAQRDFRWNGRPGFTRLDYNTQSRITYRNRTTGPWYYEQSDVINMLNFHVNLMWNDGLSLGFLAQNLLNDRGLVDPFTFEANAARSRPRTVGVEFGVAF